MKRPEEDYEGFKLYDDIQPLTRHYTLTNDELLIAGILYNLTSQGNRPMEKGYLIPSAVKKIVKQHKERFNATGFDGVYSFEKVVWPILDRLVSLGILIELKNVVKTQRGNVQSIYRNFLFNDELAKRLKNEANTYIEKPTTNSLFDF